MMNFVLLAAVTSASEHPKRPRRVDPLSARLTRPPASSSPSVERSPPSLAVVPESSHDRRESSPDPPCSPPNTRITAPGRSARNDDPRHSFNNTPDLDVCFSGLAERAGPLISTQTGGSSSSQPHNSDLIAPPSIDEPSSAAQQDDRGAAAPPDAPEPTTAAPLSPCFADGETRLVRLIGRAWKDDELFDSRYTDYIVRGPASGTDGSDFWDVVLQTIGAESLTQPAEDRNVMVTAQTMTDAEIAEVQNIILQLTGHHVSFTRRLPYAVGDRVAVFSHAVNGWYLDGTVVGIGCDSTSEFYAVTYGRRHVSNKKVNVGDSSHIQPTANFRLRRLGKSQFVPEMRRAISLPSVPEEEEPEEEEPTFED